MSDLNNIFDNGYAINNTRAGLIICYELDAPTHIIGSPWRNGSALTTSLPFFVMQLFVSNFVYHLLFYICRYFKIPRIVPQILCGVLLGPNGVGDSWLSRMYVFPYRYTMVLETFANLALVYYMFLVGLEMDLNLIKSSGTKAMSVAFSGVLIPLGIGWGLFWAVGPSTSFDTNHQAGAMFFAIALATTSFSDLARILSNLKLLRSEIGKTAMSAAVITDLITWVLLIIVISASSKQGQIYAVLATFGFVLLCWFVVRPMLCRLIEKVTKQGTEVTENHIWFVLAGVSFFGLITDICGAHSIVGAFMLGVIMPTDNIIRSMLVEKLDDFVSGIMMPLFYVITGTRNDLNFMINDLANKKIFVFVIIATFFSKIFSTLGVSLLYQMPTKDGLALGMLMNTKGIMALIIINAGRDIQALDNKTSPLMMVALFVMSLLVQPILALCYKNKRMIVHYKNRTIQRIKEDTEFRILACVHNKRNASATISLLQISNPTKRSPICVFGIHLLELTGRTTASMLIQNDEVKSRGNSVDQNSKSESDHIINAFQDFEDENEDVIAQTMTVVSPYTTMHEDICVVAEDKRVSLLILPFHKQLTTDGRMGDGNPAYAAINHNVLENAPCSVGILVDRGMGATRNSVDDLHDGLSKKQVAMIFIGGNDDREALTYAWRMLGDHSITLTVVRFIPGEEAMKEIKNEMASTMNPDKEESISSSLYERERQMDDECIYEFTFKTMNNVSIFYVEKVVNNGQETMSAIRDLEDKYDLYIVGRGEGLKSPLLSGLSDWSSCPELGTIGDTLGSSNFTMHASVLVVQQYRLANKSEAPEVNNGGSKNDVEPFMLQKKPNLYAQSDDEDEDEDDDDDDE